MEHYLKRILDWQRDDIADVYDEMPYWSVHFGKLLLDNMPIRSVNTVLDIGCGTGFPLLKIAELLGPETAVYGVDSWKGAVTRLRKKIRVHGYENVKIMEADASRLDFTDSSIDLITSNLGVNNFVNPKAVLRECCRVLAEEGRLCLTSNHIGTFREFFEVFRLTVQKPGFNEFEHALEKHISHRGTPESIRKMLEENGFTVIKEIRDAFTYRFRNGTAFLNSPIIIVGFIDSWRNIFPEEKRRAVFDLLEERLNAYAAERGELRLTVPMVYFECRK